MGDDVAEINLELSLREWAVSGEEDGRFCELKRKIK